MRCLVGAGCSSAVIAYNKTRVSSLIAFLTPFSPEDGHPVLLVRRANCKSSAVNLQGFAPRLP